MRYSIASLVGLAFLLSCFVSSITASSQRSLPLKRYAHTTSAGIDILSRQEEPQTSTIKKRTYLSSLKESRKWLKRSSPSQVLHSDKIRLSFHAFDQDFYLHLEPTENLVHPDGAQVRYVGRHPETGEETTREEKIYPHDIRAFRGVVVHPDYTSRRMIEEKIGIKRDLGDEEGVMGPAAIMLRDDGSQSGRYSFEGTFTWAGNEHTIQLPINYHNTRQESDPTISRRSLERGTPIVHRQSDVMSSLEARSLGIESEEQSAGGCNADKHEFNTQNHLFRTETNNDANSFSPFSFFASSQQISARSLFPVLRSGASQLLGSSKRDVESHYSYDLFKRQTTGGDLAGGGANSSFIGDIGSTAGCPTSARVVYMGVASDCAYTGRFSNSSEVSTTILTNMNTVSNIYRSAFRLSLGVVQLEIREANSCNSTGTPTEPWNIACSDSITLDQRLTLFSRWRGTQPSNNGIGLWHLMTSCTTSSEVGVAWLGTLCNTGSSEQGQDVTSGTGVTGSQTQEAQVMAHEIGHNFGAVHDCVTGCSISGSTATQNGGAICCPLSSNACNTGAAYLMSPVTQQVTETFSPCSIGNICTMLGGGLNTTCVSDPVENPRNTLSLQQCGNGILEPGEECDAGPNGSACCSSTCQLTSGSVCDPETSECCTDSCQFASSSFVCRPAVDERCDTAETCSGTSAVCPTDVRKADGDSCGDGLSCATGRCTSRDLQCQAQSQSGLSFTQACPTNSANSCSISCRDPSSSNSCLILQSQFIDGTQCGYGGTCQAGECQSNGWQSTFDNWYRDNLRISIPVTIVVGLLILAILYCIGRSCYRRARHGNAKKAAAINSRNSNPAWSNNAPSSHFTPPPFAPPPRRNPNQHWVNPHSFNGPSSPAQGRNNGYPSYQ